MCVADLNLPCDVDDQYSEIAGGLKSEEIVVKIWYTSPHTPTRAVCSRSELDSAMVLYLTAPCATHSYVIVAPMVQRRIGLTETAKVRQTAKVQSRQKRFVWELCLSLETIVEHTHGCRLTSFCNPPFHFREVLRLFSEASVEKLVEL